MTARYNELNELSGERLAALLKFHCSEGRAAQSAGDKDEAYRQSHIVRRICGELRARGLVAA